MPKDKSEFNFLSFFFCEIFSLYLEHTLFLNENVNNFVGSKS